MQALQKFECRAICQRLPCFAVCAQQARWLTPRMPCRSVLRAAETQGQRFVCVLATALFATSGAYNMVQKKKQDQRSWLRVLFAGCKQELLQNRNHLEVTHLPEDLLHFIHSLRGQHRLAPVQKDATRQQRHQLQGVEGDEAVPEQKHLLYFHPTGECAEHPGECDGQGVDTDPNTMGEAFRVSGLQEVLKHGAQVQDRVGLT
mmetsp:Transcript_1502/g.2871  ORF Transcript_1502/g.2871 Transcript_1502/m.2871 type:complete len:203 (+) Transcript_1502:124-732(+)